MLGTYHSCMLLYTTPACMLGDALHRTMPLHSSAQNEWAPLKLPMPVNLVGVDKWRYHGSHDLTAYAARRISLVTHCVPFPQSEQWYHCKISENKHYNHSAKH